MLKLFTNGVFDTWRFSSNLYRFCYRSMCVHRFRELGMRTRDSLVRAFKPNVWTFFLFAGIFQQRLQQRLQLEHHSTFRMCNHITWNEKAGTREGEPLARRAAWYAPIKGSPKSLSRQCRAGYCVAINEKNQSGDCIIILRMISLHFGLNDYELFEFVCVGVCYWLLRSCYPHRFCCIPSWRANGCVCARAKHNECTLEMSQMKLISS